MAHVDVETKIMSHLADNWTQSQIFEENVEDETLPDGEACIQVQFPFSNTSRPYVSNKLYKEEGAFRILIRVPRGIGKEIIGTWGEQLRQLFEDTNVDGVNCRVPSTPFTDERSDAGAFYVGYIAVPFDYQWRRD